MIAVPCRLSQLAEVSGKGAPNRSVLQKLLDSDFDPSAWDKHMSAAFDEEYYAGALLLTFCAALHLLAQQCRTELGFGHAQVLYTGLQKRNARMT